MAGHHTYQSGEGLTHLDTRFLAGCAAQRGERPNLPHRPFQIDIDRPGNPARKWRQVDRASGQLAMHPVGDEGCERSEQPASNRKDFVERCEGRAIVLCIDVVEAMAALAHVPFRHVLIEESHHRFGGVGCLVAAHQLIGLALDRGQP